MAESYIQVPVDSTGKKMRLRSRVISSNTVHEQAVFQAAMDTFTVAAVDIAPAANKWHVGVFNGVGSGVLVKVRKFFCIPTNTTAVTGVLLRFNAMRTTAQSGGTTLTPVSHDTTNAAIPAQVLTATNATVTGSGTLWPFVTISEEETAATPLSKQQFLQGVNLMMESPEIQELTLREGQGFGIQQVTSSTVGVLSWLLIMTIETP